ncbi:MAG TPA: glycosyltransferase family 4 protein [Caulobacteraceae bacterium]
MLPANFTLLQVVPRLDAGGVEQTTVDVSRAVVAAGGRSIVATAGGRMADQVEGAGGELALMPVDSKNPATVLVNSARLARLAKAERVSLIHVRSRAPAVSALAAANQAGVPLIATYHGVYNARSWLKRWYNSVMTRGDLVIANSDFTARHLIAEHRVDPSRVIAIPRGIDLGRFDPKAVPAGRAAAMRESWGLGPEDRRTVFLLAGRLTRWKGQGLAIEAAARLKAQGREDFVLVLAGDDQGRTAYRQELEAAVDLRGLVGTVALVGHCVDMPAAWMASDIGLVPSLEPEAFGRTAVEPQAMGRPVIAAAHGAPCETVIDGETGWLATPGHGEAWAGAMATALDAGPATRWTMGAAAMRRARRLYSVDAMIAATFGVYRRALEARA